MKYSPIFAVILLISGCLCQGEEFVSADQNIDFSSVDSKISTLIAKKWWRSEEGRPVFAQLVEVKDGKGMFQLPDGNSFVKKLAELNRFDASIAYYLASAEAKAKPAYPSIEAIYEAERSEEILRAEIIPALFDTYVFVLKQLRKESENKRELVPSRVPTWTVLGRLRPGEKRLYTEDGTSHQRFQKTEMQDYCMELDSISKFTMAEILKNEPDSTSKQFFEDVIDYFLYESEVNFVSITTYPSKNKIVSRSLLFELEEERRRLQAAAVVDALDSKDGKHLDFANVMLQAGVGAKGEITENAKSFRGAAYAWAKRHNRTIRQVGFFVGKNSGVPVRGANVLEEIE